jgi:hypothetical protein
VVSSATPVPRICSWASARASATGRPAATLRWNAVISGAVSLSGTGSGEATGWLDPGAVVAAVAGVGRPVHGDAAGAHVVVPLESSAAEKAVIAAAAEREVALDGLARPPHRSTGRAGIVLGYAGPVAPRPGATRRYRRPPLDARRVDANVEPVGVDPPDQWRMADFEVRRRFAASTAGEVGVQASDPIGDDKE